MEMKKILAVSIILLFFGVTIAPTINFNTVKASTEDDLVEVTTQACGIQGYEDTTVKLTREQYQNLQEYLVEFRIRLNQTSTREEAIPIFKEAVVELDKYGLLPKGMDIRHAQELVTGGFLNQKSLDMLKTFSFRNPTVRNNSNYLCLITGHLSIVFFFPAIVHLVLMSLLYFAEYLLEYYTAGGIIAFIAKLILFGLYYLIPQIVGSLRFSINNFIFTTESGEHSPTDGWLNTVGLLGIKKWNGSIIGSLPFNLLPHNLLAAGFTGFKLRTEGTEYGFEFIGNALAVSVENES